MIGLSQPDLDRFGIVVAKAQIGPQTDLDDLLRACSGQAVRLLIARCPTDLLGQVQGLERRGAILADTLVWWHKEPLEPAASELPRGYTARTASSADAGRVQDLAALAFRDFGGHYHADGRLPRAQCDAVYASWAGALCTDPGEQGCMQLMLDAGSGEVVGFAGLRRLDGRTLDGSLFGVHPAHRGRGLLAALLRLAQAWGSTRQMARMEYSTQVGNVAAQRALCAQGFRPLRSVHTLHRWFD